MLPATSGADQIGRLRATRAALASQEQGALLQLYSLHSNLDRARGRLADVQRRLESARSDRNTARRQLRIARRTLAVADARLGAQLRAIYVYDRPDVLSVLLGAASLDDVITGLDSMHRTTASTGALIVLTRRAHDRVARRLHSLTRRTARLARLRAAAAATEASIVGRQAERAAYISSLRTKQRLTGGQIAEIESRARAAEAASTVVTVQAHATKSILAPPPPVHPAPSPAAQARVRPAVRTRQAAHRLGHGLLYARWDGERTADRPRRRGRRPDGHPARDAHGHPRATGPASPPTRARRSRAYGSTCGSRP